MQADTLCLARGLCAVDLLCPFQRLSWTRQQVRPKGRRILQPLAPAGRVKGPIQDPADLLDRPVAAAGPVLACVRWPLRNPEFGGDQVPGHDTKVKFIPHPGGNQGGPAHLQFQTFAAAAGTPEIRSRIRVVCRVCITIPLIISLSIHVN